MDGLYYTTQKPSPVVITPLAYQFFFLQLVSENIVFPKHTTMFNTLDSNQTNNNTENSINT